MRDDRWLTRLKALTGIALLGYEVVVQHTLQPWIFILILWLLGAQLEALITLLTAGRIQINVERHEPPEPPAPVSPPPSPPSSLPPATGPVTPDVETDS